MVSKDNTKFIYTGSLAPAILVVRFSLVSIFKKVQTCLAHAIFPTGIPLLILIFYILWLLMISLLLILFKWIFARLKNVKAKDRAYNLSQSMVIQNDCFFQNCILISRVQSLMTSLNM